MNPTYSLWKTASHRLTLNIMPTTPALTREILRLTGGYNAVIVTRGEPELQVSLRESLLPEVAEYLGLSDYDIGRLMDSDDLMLRQELEVAS